MNLPNTLTLGRIFSAPLFFVLFFLPQWFGVPRTALIPLLWALFLLSEVTDALDGYLARKMNCVTDLGKLMDPFADVVSRLTYFVCFVGWGWMPLAALLVILYRELGITFIRMMMFRTGTALAARIGGKLKAIFYFVSGLFGMAALSVVTYWPQSSASPWMVKIAIGLFIGAAAAALISFVDYLLVFIRFLRDNPRRDQA